MIVHAHHEPGGYRQLQLIMEIFIYIHIHVLAGSPVNKPPNVIYYL